MSIYLHVGKLSYVTDYERKKIIPFPYYHPIGTSLIGFVVFGLLLFLPAWMFNYWQAWIFIAVFTIVTSVPSIYLALKNPAALQRRMHAGPAAETRTVQKFIGSADAICVVRLEDVVAAIEVKGRQPAEHKTIDSNKFVRTWQTKMDYCSCLALCTRACSSYPRDAQRAALFLLYEL